AVGVSAVDGPRGARHRADRGRRLPAAAAVRHDPARPAADQRRRGAARRGVPAPVGSRPRAAAPGRLVALALPALREPRDHRAEADAAAAGLRVRAHARCAQAARSRADGAGGGAMTSGTLRADRVDSAPLTLEVVRDPAVFAAMGAEWNDLLARSPQAVNPMLSHE